MWIYIPVIVSIVLFGIYFFRRSWRFPEDSLARKHFRQLAVLCWVASVILSGFFVFLYVFHIRAESLV